MKNNEDHAKEFEGSKEPCELSVEKKARGREMCDHQMSENTKGVMGVNDLPQATIQVEESVILHVEEEISNAEHCDLMRDKNIEKESIEIEEKDRLEENES
ncbi:hypothetical protein M9H77_30569 [Catharanthus roseus]|uniref:Uncharacterized protein n=1 Tax=Catharanthus roseus TaxID=4058 RepID=A0ACB9ZXN6_CATRO|nr:hypothetical protein M9H77_30569 [Catharanthus roseus]